MEEVSYKTFTFKLKVKVKKQKIAYMFTNGHDHREKYVSGNYLVQR